MKKRYYLLGIFILIISFSLAGCGAGNGSQTAQSGTVEADLHADPPKILDQEGNEVNEDLNDLLEQGYEIYVDTSIPSGHSMGDFAGRLTGTDGKETLLYYATIAQDGERAQELMNMGDAAVYFRYGHLFCIADHADQFPEDVSKIKTGDTVTIRDDQDAVTTYICSYVCEGTNSGHLYDDQGEDIELTQHGDLCIYTSEQGTGKVKMAFFTVQDAPSEEAETEE